MELKDVIIVVVIFALVTLIINFLRGRGSKNFGYKSMTFHELFHMKVGFQKVDGSQQFAMVIENASDQEVIIKDMYLEIKKGTRYQKQNLPASSFDSSKEMRIPNGKSGAAFLKLKEFHKLFIEESLLKAVVVDQKDKVYKSQVMIYNPKSKSLELK